MIALLKTIRKAFLAAFILAGAIPFVFTHWMPCASFASAGFMLPAAPVSSNPGTPHHKVCWRAEDHSARDQKAFSHWESSGIGESLVYLPGQAEIPPCVHFSSHTPAVLSILRI
jgi:hypothetical protein